MSKSLDVENQRRETSLNSSTEKRRQEFNELNSVLSKDEWGEINMKLKSLKITMFKRTRNSRTVLLPNLTSKSQIYKNA